MSKSTKIEEAASMAKDGDNVKALAIDLTLTDVGSKSMMEGSCVAKSLFSEPSDCQIHYANMHKNIASSSCSLTASETLVVSPVKHPGYYAIERNLSLNSPSKVPYSVIKRGKLDFNNTDTSASLEERVAAKTSNLSASMEVSDVFDFPDLDFLGGDISFSELLADIDLDPEHQLPHAHDPTSERCSRNVGNEHSETNKFVSYSSLSTVKGLSGGMIIQGADTVTSVRSITKRIKLVNPAKPQSSLHCQKISTATDVSSGNN